MEANEQVTVSSFKIAQQRRTRESSQIISNMAAGFLKAPTMRRVMYSSLQNLLSSWSKTNAMKQRISNKIMSAARNKNPLDSLESQVFGASDLGKLLTILAQKANANLSEAPTSLADKLEPTVRDFIKSTDFGELKELLDRSEAPLVDLVGRLMGFIWNTYPAKLGALMSMVHPIANLTVRSLGEIVTPLNGVSPDLLADLILAIAGSIDGQALGKLSNGLLEMARQIHTGSLLQGESGVSQFQMDLTAKLRQIMSEIDPERLAKFKVIAAENAEERAHARSAVMAENPDLELDLIARLAALKNPKIRSMNRRAQVYDDLPRDRLAHSLAVGLDELDMQTLSETVNTAVRMFNQVHAEQPDCLTRLLDNFLMNIDTDELKTATQSIMQDVSGALRPIADEIMPVIAQGLSDLNASS